jgi:hypothetical protein
LTGISAAIAVPPHNVAAAATDITNFFIFDPFPQIQPPKEAATPVQRDARKSPEFAPGRSWQKVNITVGITGKAKGPASAAFLGVFGLSQSKESKCCKTSTDLNRQARAKAFQPGTRRLRRRSYPQAGESDGRHRGIDSGGPF